MTKDFRKHPFEVKAGAESEKTDADSLTSSITQVDLGEDLLEAKTRVLDLALDFSGVPEDLTPSNPAKPPRVRSDLESQFQSAAILLREGMLDEAKRVLRGNLLLDDRHAPSRKLLEEIHERELKQMFSSSEEQAPSRTPTRREEDPDSVLDALDRDLGLGLARAAAAVPTLSLFLEFEAESPPSVPGILPRDRVDLGVAFMEMGFLDLAIRQFEFACSATLLGAKDSAADDQLITYTGLLARAQIEAGHSFAATTSLEPILRDTDVAHEKKLELLYLMGRALEELRQEGQALRWYLQAAQLEPEYRDVRARVERLREKTRS